MVYLLFYMIPNQRCRQYMDLAKEVLEHWLKQVWGRTFGFNSRFVRFRGGGCGRNRGRRYSPNPHQPRRGLRWKN